MDLQDKHGFDLAEQINWQLGNGQLETASRVKAALEAVLLFHGASLWDTEKQHAWQRCVRYVTRKDEPMPATTKSLCDLVRIALNITETKERPSP